MNGSAASVAYWILPLILGVLTLSVLALVALSVRKEDSRRFSLRGAAPGVATQVTRRLTRFGAAGLPVQPRGRVS
jgi:hypothetical protein